MKKYLISGIIGILLVFSLFLLGCDEFGGYGSVIVKNDSIYSNIEVRIINADNEKKIYGSGKCGKGNIIEIANLQTLIEYRILVIPLNSIFPDTKDISDPFYVSNGRIKTFIYRGYFIKQ
jgi:hypothetical protein